MSRPLSTFPSATRPSFFARQERDAATHGSLRLCCRRTSSGGEGKERSGQRWRTNPVPPEIEGAGGEGFGEVIFRSKARFQHIDNGQKRVYHPVVGWKFLKYCRARFWAAMAQGAPSNDHFRSQRQRHPPSLSDRKHVVFAGKMRHNSTGENGLHWASVCWWFSVDQACGNGRCPLRPERDAPI